MGGSPAVAEATDRPTSMSPPSPLQYSIFAISYSRFLTSARDILHVIPETFVAFVLPSIQGCRYLLSVASLDIFRSVI